jgi:hypothetical protein
VIQRRGHGSDSSEPFDVEQRGRDVKPRVQCPSVGVFRSIENPNQRPDVFEARLTWIGFAGLDPRNILRGRRDARFDAAVSFLDGRRPTSSCAGYVSK